ncbi:MAG: bifunctional diguanylate cyclase/phosphodiesterase [Gallionella sp.]|nr:bifunctional diguanylate cyclase/phosphodiesterase [Gallionella sp.]
MQPPQVEPIAGFINRKDCFAEIAQLATLATPDRPLAVIWIALDRFKQVNESFGHRGGDVVIAQLCQRLRNRTGTRGIWCRMAGDEFVCLVSDYNFDQIQQLAADLLHEIESPLPIGGLLLHPSASLGIAILEESERPSLCLQRADRAMNTSKRAGGGRIITSGSEPMPGRLGVLLARHELELESKLHLALNHGGLNLHYQPCVDTDGQIISVEALMRCPAHHIFPGEFIPIAEKTGLIIRLGEWSLLEGARFAKHLSVTGQRTVVSINVSRAQFIAPNFSQTLHAALLCADVDPELIELELTESLFMDNSRLVQANLRAALDTGVKIAIDDFGTGYSCLATLKDITASKLKLDRAFVVALPQDRRAFAVVKAIAQLGHDLGMRVVAEGVENQQQLDALRDAGVHTIQGYFYARPMPENELMAWLQKQKKTT